MSRIHRDHPEASPEEIEALQLRERMMVPITKKEPEVDKVCRDCGTIFKVPESKLASGSKWYSLCGSCIVWEL